VRRILEATQQVHRKGYERGVDPDEFITEAQDLVNKAFRETVRGGPERIGEVLPKVYHNVLQARELGGEVVGMSTGFGDIDRWHLGLHRTDMIVLGARPAMGKSAFALNLAVNVAAARHGPERRRGRVAVFSLEMGRDQLVMRMLSSYARIKLGDLRKGKISLDDENHLRAMSAEMSQFDLYLDDTPGLTPGELRARCKRLEMSGPLDLVVIDYLQLMQGSKGVKQSREQEIGEISRSLKGLAKDLKCTVLALSQLNRSLEKTDDKGKGGPKRRPQMSDLRESGSIEQDADIIWFIHRDAYYQETENNKFEAELIVAKQRAGRTGTIMLSYDGEYTRFDTRTVNDGYAHGDPYP
jgi:replicative DNA helicase